MSQNNSPVFRQFTKTAALTLVLGASFGVLPPSAHGAVVADSYARSFKTQSAKVSLFDLTHDTQRILDWRSPETEIRFDVPEGDFTRALTLSLTATAQGNISKTTPLLVSLNGGKAVPVRSGGQGFDATLSLSPSRLRNKNNRLTISYKTPSGLDCLTEAQGSWTLDLAQSHIALSTQERPRGLRISEVEPRLSHPMTAPDAVGIIVKGGDRLTQQALIAQGVGLRMQDMPSFVVTQKAAPFTIFAGTRDALRGVISDPAALGGSGAAIAVQTQRPMALVLTGDSQAEIDAAVKSFATHRLPAVGRERIALGEMDFQPTFEASHIGAGASAGLEALGYPSFDMTYRPAPAHIDFTAIDGRHGAGEFLIDLTANDAIAKNSRLAVSLNGQALGYTTLDKRHKKVAFPIAASAVKASNNRITLTPQLEPAAAGCLTYGNAPGLTLNPGTRLSLGRTAQGQSLSTFAASGGAFAASSGALTTVVLPAQDGAERGAALTLMARIAKASGAGMIAANYTDSAALAKSTGHNVLYIGAMDQDGAVLLDGAPRALNEALSGQSFSIANAENIVQVAANGRQAFAAAARTSDGQRRRLAGGGVAALYDHQSASGRVIGLITAQNSAQFTRAANRLAADDHWDKLSGTVTRFTAQDVIMAQDGVLATPLPAPRRDAPTRALLTKAVHLTVQASDQIAAKSAAGFSALTRSFDLGRDTDLSAVLKAPSTVSPSAPQTAPVAAAIALPSARPSAKAAAPAALRGRVDAVAASPRPERALAARASTSRPAAQPLPPAAMTKKPSRFDSVKQAMSLEGFSWDYFKSNVSAQTRLLRKTMVDWIGGAPSSRETEAKVASLFSNKTAWLLLACVALVFGVGLAAPSGLNRNIR